MVAAISTSHLGEMVDENMYCVSFEITKTCRFPFSLSVCLSQYGEFVVHESTAFVVHETQGPTFERPGQHRAV